MLANEILNKVLSLLKNVKEHDGFWTSLCPAHDDSENSLSITLGQDDRVLLKCHKNCHAANVVQSLGMSFKELFPKKEHAKGERSDKGVLVATYDYHDATSKLIFQVCRYEKSVAQLDHTVKKEKTFIQRRPDGKGGWVYNMKDVQRELYGLLDILHRTDEPVWILEGEKAVDYCKSLGLLATTAAGGAGKKWDEHYNTALHGRDVIVVPDHDPIAPNKAGTKFESVGREKAEKIADSVIAVAKSVHVLELPEAQDKWGLDDWLQSGHPLEALGDLMANCPAWVKGSLLFRRTMDDSVKDDNVEDECAYEKKCMEDLGIYVLGETNEGNNPGFMIYSMNHKKTHVIKDPSKFRLANLLAFAGPKVKSKIFAGSDDCPNGMYRMSEVIQSISTLAGARPLESSLFGAGVWRINDAMVLVGAGECAILRDEENAIFEQSLTPEFGDKVFDLRSSGTWFEVGFLNECLPLARMPEWRREIVNTMDAMCRMWTFNRGEYVPQLLTGLILASWVQSIWNWRPQVFVFGESGCGKTTWFQLLCGQGPESSGGLFGALSLCSSDYTSAAIRSGIGKTSKIAVLDEMENGKNRKEFMVLARGAGRGSAMLRGTATHKMVSTRLAQIFWVGSTETGLEREMDQNRYLIIEMLKVARRTIKFPPEHEVRELGQKLLVSIVAVARQALELASFLAAQPIPGVPGRVVESYSVPTAAYAAVMGMNESDALQLMINMIGGFESDSVESDSRKVLDTILNTIIDVDREKVTVAALVSEAAIGQGVFFDSKREAALANVGLRVCLKDERLSENHITNKQDGKYLFISNEIAKRYLLKDTEWRDQKIQERLTRIPGVYKDKKKLQLRTSQLNGVMVPLRIILEHSDAKPQE